ncbi:MAG: methyl-accepting chemotaxis protein [Lachnospiraceae bacterium]|nr:methyl-accepting chemotaxis protein [Lachnospiraceae bacterium]
MKALNNISVRVKLLILTLPLVVCIIVSVIFAGVKINSTEEQVTDAYYNTLYQVNSTLINADRDFYQSLVGATQAYDIANGYSSMPKDMIAAKLPEKIEEYKKNRQQVLDNVEKALEIARGNEELYKNIRSDNGYNFEETEKKFEEDFNAWEALYDVENNTGDWSRFNEEFETARAVLEDMQEITESWALEEHAALSAANTRGIVISAFSFGIIIIVLVSLAIMIIRQITGGLTKATTALDEVGGGNLAYQFAPVEEMGNDEIGRIRKSAKSLTDKLREVIEKTKMMSDELTQSGTELADSANQASQASSQVTEAVDEISKGAVSQAESVETSAHDATDIGEIVEATNNVITELSGRTSEMKATCDSAMEAMRQLLSQNANTVKSMQNIHTQIVATNNAVKDIAEASQIITDISSQTNLLSLNASIEAARAGEAGRGFAVVASEIGSLADQSGSAAVKISEIVKNLVEESAKSVATIDALNESFAEQNRQLDSTNSDMETMADGVEDVARQTNEISQQAQSLNESKESLVNIISDLSAISEENAAATEETNASMEELNATFTIISESAGQLQKLAHELAESISYFRI